jgi:hypothetical protein
LKVRPQQTDRATSLATGTPSETRRDFFRRRRARQRSSRGSDRAHGSTEWRCQQHPSRGCSFAGHQPQPSANVNHEYTRMNTNRFTFRKRRMPRITRIRRAHACCCRWNALSSTRWERNAALAARYLRVPRIIGHRLQEKPIHRGEQRIVFANSRKEKSEPRMT